MDATPVPVLEPVAISDEERAAMIHAVREFAESELAPHALRRDADEDFPLDTLRAAGELGLGALFARPEHGGTGLSRADAVPIFEELAAGDPALAAYI